MRRIFSLAAIGLLTAGGWLALTEEASAQRGRGGWSGGRGYGGSGYSGRGYGYGYGYPGYGSPGVTFGGRNWGVTIPFDSGYSNRGYYRGYDYPGYYSARPYYYGGYSYPETYSEGGYEEAAAAQNSAQIEVIVPDPNAEVRFNGRPTNETGRRRVFHTAALEPGYKYSYEIDAQWQENGQRRSDSRTVELKPGGRVLVDFSRQQAGTQRPDSEAQELRQQPRPPQQPQQPSQRPQRPPQTPDDAPPIP